jgi:hypothetical protein
MHLAVRVGVLLGRFTEWPHRQVQLLHLLLEALLLRGLAADQASKPDHGVYGLAGRLEEVVHGYTLLRLASVDEP